MATRKPKPRAIEYNPVWVLSLYRGIQRARKERETLISDFGRCPGFVE